MTFSQLTDSQILDKALEAQAQNGPDSLVEVLVPRLPERGRYTKQMCLRPKQGPRGRVVALTPEGTLVEFQAGKLISFLAVVATTAAPTKKLQARTAERVQIHPVISRSYAEKLAEISASKGLSISAILDNVLGVHLEQYA
jgi:hypothetical protein